MPTTTTYPGCTPCCGGQITNCCNPPCAAWPNAWKITVAGIGDGSGPCVAGKCAFVNGTFTLELFTDAGGVCHWRTATLAVCLPPVGNPFRWDFYCDTVQSKMRLGYAAAASVTWVKTYAAFTCLAANVLTSEDDGAGNHFCGNLPATITITPA